MLRYAQFIHVQCFHHKSTVTTDISHQRHGHCFTTTKWTVRYLSHGKEQVGRFIVEFTSHVDVRYTDDTETTREHKRLTSPWYKHTLLLYYTHTDPHMTACCVQRAIFTRNQRLRYDGSRPGVQSASLYDNFCKTGKWRHWWRHNLGSRWKLQKMARENLSIAAFYNITKNQDNPIKTVGRDSFLSPKTPKNTSFLGVTQCPGVAQPLYSRGHN